MITFEKVSKKFENQKEQTLKNISFEITNNDFVVLLGPSGSGKSTILHLMAGLTPATSGKISIDKKPLHTLNDNQISHYRNQNIGFIFQEFHLIPHLTVSENVLLPLKISGQNIAESELKTILKEVGLSQKSQELPSSLSGGQKQRVAIARALINNPSIIIADEPTGNLDQLTAQKIIELLKKLHETRKTTLIIATHDQEISKLAKRKIFIRDGEISSN